MLGRGGDHTSHSARLWRGWSYTSSSPLCLDKRIMGDLYHVLSKNMVSHNRRLYLIMKKFATFLALGRCLK